MSLYAALWRRLPGGRLARSVQLLALVAVVLAVLTLWVFPYFSTVLPTHDIAVR
jgi:hypothetical protein